MSPNFFKPKELKRYNKLFSTLTKFGFKDVMVNSQIRKIIPKSYLKNHPETDKMLSFSKFERIRMVLEELGPTFIKLGQIFSNREDMLPRELIKELEKLQDNAPALKNFDITKVIEEELDIVVSEYFRFIDSKPLAAASLAQVHKAELVNGDKVVLKIKRPNIEEIIEADILVMKQIAKNLDKYSKQAKAFQPLRIVASFEKSIKEELQFLKEIDNVERFAKNFEDDESIYVPNIYHELSNDHIICMEFIDGVKVSEIDKLAALNINSKKIAKVGVDLYLKQILKYGFFHADPHPGNIFILPETGKLCFIDFGMMGNIMPNDKELLEELLLYFMHKDVKRIIVILEKIAVKSSIPDYKKLEYDLYELIEGVSNIAIQNIKMNSTIEQFKNILYENEITSPHYLYMLMRSLVIIEGVGLKLDPEFNITDNLQPFMTTIALKRFNLKRLFNKNIKRFQDLNELIDTLPNDIYTILGKIKDGKLVVIHKHKGIKEFQNSLNKASNRLVFSIIIAALSIGSSLLVMADMPPKIKGIPLLGAIGFTLSAVLGFIIVISILRNNKF